MQAKEFDNALRAQYGAGSFSTLRPDWESLSRQLDAPVKKRIVWWQYSVAAALLAAIVMLAPVLFPTAKVPGIAGKQKGAAQPHATQPVTTVPGVGTGTAPVAAIAPLAMSHYSTITTDKSRLHPEKPRAKVQPAIQDSQPLPTQGNMVTPVIVTTENRNIEDYTSQATLQAIRQKTVVSLLGGIQSGTLHTGYTVGVSMQHPVGRRFSLGGSLAVVSAVAQQSLTLSAARYQALTSGIGASVIAPAGSAASGASLYYLQLAPAMGYAITRRLQLATGPDYQRLLQDANSKTLIYADNKTQLAPVNDFGWNGGLDYAVTHHLQCGFRYRAGINSWLQPAAGQLNRSYLQAHVSVQLGR